MKPGVVERAERLLGLEAEAWAQVTRKGYSLNEHWTVRFDDGTRAFLKQGEVDPSPQWIRDERDVFAAVGGAFMPRFIGFEDGDAPLLMLEDLMPARWPPPWRDGDVELVLGALAEVAATTVRGTLPRVEEVHGNDWYEVQRNPAPFLSTGLRDDAWVEHTLPRLLEAADAAPVHGDSLVHCDVRSDNLCLKDGRCVLVDWNHARLGNPKYDIAFWLPSLVLERGPGPDGFGVDEFAARVAGFFAARAGLPKPAGAPTVRDFQRVQAEVALDWAERVL
jgi:phosphotransferase family enzyme